MNALPNFASPRGFLCQFLTIVWPCLFVYFWVSWCVRHIFLSGGNLTPTIRFDIFKWFEVRGPFNFFVASPPVITTFLGIVLVTFKDHLFCRSNTRSYPWCVVNNGPVKWLEIISTIFIFIMPSHSKLKQKGTSYLGLLMTRVRQVGYLYFHAVTMLIYSGAWVSLFARGQPLEYGYRHTANCPRWIFVCGFSCLSAGRPDNW